MSDDSIIKILSELVSFKTFSPDILNSQQFTSEYKVPDSFFKCRKFIERILLEANFKTENYEFGGFPMLVAWHRPEKHKNATRILLLMHFDVVPAEKTWKNAFKMTTRDDSELGKVAEGRGVTDMKGGVSALLASVKKISEFTNGDICIGFTSDEELGGARGTANLLSEIFRKKKNWMPQYVITADAAGEEIINLRRNAHFIRATFPRTKKKITGIKKVLTFNSKIISAKTSHAAYYRKEIDQHAVYEASKYLDKNNEYILSITGKEFLKTNIIPKEVVLELVVPNNNNIKDPKNSLEYEIEDSLTEIMKMLHILPSIPLPQGKTSLGTNITVNIINLFEERIEMLIDLRSMLKSTDKELLEDSFRSLFSSIRFEPKVEIQSFAGPIITPEDSLLVRSAKKAWKSVTGKDITTAERGGATDARFFSHLGIECIDIGPIGFNVHSTNETVVLESLKRLSNFFPELVKTLSSKEMN
ncbi:MAG: Succinyl-diaminopimelate desuccinylase [Candidatus Heimdallarchaeota archaeon LC_3]|nr:MAG: Succinyl-diaminopimelate desuccinylase [Candidatus Heimdallarchaeota archaeon LC_3]